MPPRLPRFACRVFVCLGLCLGLWFAAAARPAWAQVGATPPGPAASAVAGVGSATAPVAGVPSAGPMAKVAGASDASVLLPDRTAVQTPSAAAVPPLPATAGSSQVVPLLPAGLVPMSRIDSGDTAWMITATALVLLMSIPGLALFYAGMVRKKNILATMAQVLAICALVSLLWFAVGYSLAFRPGTPWLGDGSAMWLGSLRYDRLHGLISVHAAAPTVPESVFVMFQLSFAIITPALIVGAFAERMRFAALLWFIGLWSLAVYAPIAHWVWGPGGWLADLGALDFAGGTVVHLNAGVAGLVAARMLGPRLGYGRVALTPSNLGYTLVGASLLWVGWMGFNGGSSGAADGRAGLALLSTQLAAAAATLSWMLAEWLVRRTPTLLGLCSGAVAGLVAVTPASGFVSPGSAVLIGAIAGLGCYWGATGLKRLLGADDSLDVFGVHGVGGLIGALLTGVLADPLIGGVSGSLAAQAAAAGATMVYSGVATALILWLVDVVVGLRVLATQEHAGLDLSQHGEQVE